MSYEELNLEGMLGNIKSLAEIADLDEAIQTHALAIKAKAVFDIDTDKIETILRNACAGHSPDSRTLRLLTNILHGDPYPGDCYFHLAEEDSTPQNKLKSRRISYAVNAVLGMKKPDGEMFVRHKLRIDHAWWRLAESGGWVRLEKGEEDIRSYISDAFSESPDMEVRTDKRSYRCAFGDEATDSLVAEAYKHIEEYGRPPALREGRMAYADRWKPFDLLTGAILEPSIPLKDVVVWLDEDGSISTTEHISQHFYHAAREYRWADDDEIDTPLFDGYLDDIAEDNEDARHQLMVALGQIAAGENPHQKAIMLIGPKRTGKSVFTGLAENLAGGPQASVELHLKELSDKFVAPHMAGSTLIQFDEVGARPTGGTALTQWTDGLLYLKKLIGGDKLEGRRMYSTEKEKFSMAGANVLMTSNDPPRFAGDLEGDAGAWEDRIYPIPFTNTKEVGSRNAKLLRDMIETELPAIARKVIEYWANSEERLTGIYQLGRRSQRLLIQIAGSDFKSVLDALVAKRGRMINTDGINALAAIATGDTNKVKTGVYRKLRAAILSRFPDADPEATMREDGKRKRGIGGVDIGDPEMAEAVKDWLDSGALAR